MRILDAFLVRVAIDSPYRATSGDGEGRGEGARTRRNEKAPGRTVDRALGGVKRIGLGG